MNLQMIINKTFMFWLNDKTTMKFMTMMWNEIIENNIDVNEL